MTRLRWVSFGVFVLGLGLTVVGIWQICKPAAYIGAGLILMAIAVETGGRRNEHTDKNGGGK